MSIKYKSVRQLLKEDNITEFPSLAVFDTKGNTVKVMQWQPKSDLSFSEERGFYSTSEEHEKKCRAFLQYAVEEHQDIVLTPEYSSSWRILQDILDEKEISPKNGKLWCLGMEGISIADMEKFYKSYNRKKKVHLIMEDLNTLNQNNFFSCIAYLFRIRKSIICVIQLKTTAAADAWSNFEANGLTFGHDVYYFSDENNRVYLFSLICADALNQDVVTQREQISYQQCIILHPQLNPKPWHSSFDMMRKNFFDYSNKAVRIVSANWAKGTNVVSADNEKIVIENSYSAFYYNKNISDIDLAKLLTLNAPKGMYLAKNEYIYIWYMEEHEHAMAYTIDSFDANNIDNATTNHKEPLAKVYLEYNSVTGKWESKAKCSFCPIDWDWLENEFNLPKCDCSKCDLDRLFMFFAIMFCHAKYADLDVKDRKVQIIFNKSIGEIEDLVRLRERSEDVNRAVQNGILPAKFQKLKSANYQWILDEQGNLAYNLMKKDGKIENILSVAFVEVSSESVIKRKIAELERLMGKDSIDRLILYTFTGNGIKYYEDMYNTDINNPELTHSVDTFK